jgi:hypothetical protein
MEVELNGRKLRVYECGKIESFFRNRYWIELTNNPDNYGYCRLTINKKRYFKHRVIGMVYLGLDITNSKSQIDHIDRNKLNNHASNLRIVSQQQNMYNISNVKGYSWDKRKKKYRAGIKLGRKPIYLGYFATEDEAHNAYLESKVKYHIID